MKWILIQPRYKYNVAFPLSLAHVATFLSKKLDEDVLCFDLNLQSIQSVFKYLKNNKITPDVFGFSSTSMTKSETIVLCQKTKKLFPDTKTIIGGAAAQGEYGELLRYDAVDYCYISDIEQIGTEGPRPLTLDDLPSLPGIARMENGKIRINQIKSLTHLDHFPFPDRELEFIQIENYHSPEVIKEYHPATLITSRGCPFHCSYCASARTGGRRVIWRSAESVIEELDYLRGKGYNSFIFEDYEFLFNQKRFQKICGNLNVNNSKWVLKTRIERIDEKVARLLEESGCLIVYLGVETLTQKAINEAKSSKINVKSVKLAIELLKKHNLRICVSIQYGLPFDTEEEFLEGTICFLKKVLDPNEDMVQLHFTTLFPNTDLYDSYISQAVTNNIHQEFEDVVAHGMEGYLMPNLTADVVRRVYERSHDILGKLLTRKAIWFN